MEEKNKFPGGLFERIWIISLVVGIFLKISGVIGWIGFLLIITVWPVIVMIGVIAAIIIFVNMNNQMKKEEGEDDGHGS